MKLIVVTAPTFFVEEDQILTALFEEGLDILHIRKPETPAMYSERLLTLIPQKYHHRIVTHEHFYLQEEFGLMGIHLNSRNPSEPHDYSGHVSCTCHSIQELQSKKHFYDYIFLSPIYDCITKAGVSGAFTPEELRQARRSKLIDSNVMALGGVTLDNISVSAEGHTLTARNSADITVKCCDRDYRNIIEHFKKLQKAAD